MSTSSKATGSGQKVECASCPLRKLDAFRPFEPQELEFVSSFKRGELMVDRAATVLVEGSNSAHLYTVLSGWGFRYKMLDDGRRQILNYALPGDLIGLQGVLMGELEHSVEALTPMRLCVFERNKLMTLYANHAGLAYDVTWLASREEQLLDENLLSIGRRSAAERAAYLLASLHVRWKALGGSGTVTLPIRQHHVADTLGLSLVHTNKTLRKLASAGLIEWVEAGCRVLDAQALIAKSGWNGLARVGRPLI